MIADDLLGTPPIARLQGVDDRGVFRDELRHVAAPDVGEADPHQAVGLLDEVAGRARHAPIAGRICKGHMEIPVVTDEIRVGGKRAELVEIRQRGVAGPFGCRRGADRLDRQTKLEEIARVRDRNRVDLISLTRANRYEPILLQPQKRLAHGLPADAIARRQILLPHFRAGRKPASQDIDPEGIVDVIAQKQWTCPFVTSPRLAQLKYHVNRSCKS